MARTLDNILEDFAGKISGNDATSLKKLKATLKAKEEAYKESIKEGSTATGDQKATAKDELAAANTAYDDARERLIALVKRKIDEEKEKKNLVLYSEEVAKRREGRKASAISEKITEVQGSLEILSLDIAAIDKQIEEARKGLTPAPTE